MDRPPYHSAVHMRMFETETTGVRPLVGIPGLLLCAQPNSDAKSTAWPMICEHAHPCPPVPSLDADGVWRWATDAVISKRQRRTIVTASVEATEGKETTGALRRTNGCRCLEMPKEQARTIHEVKHSG